MRLAVVGTEVGEDHMSTKAERKEMDISKIAKDLEVELGNTFKKCFDLNLRDGEWTKEVKTAACRIGQSLGYCTAASGVDGSAVGPNPHYGEWLYDVCWLKYNDPPEHLLSAPMVLECEWPNNAFDVRDDFQKLLLAKSDLKVMIFEDKKIDCSVTEMFGQLKHYVRGFEGHRRQDAWLFIGYKHDKSKEVGAATWVTSSLGLNI